MKILHLMLGCFYIDNYSYQENYLPKFHKIQGHEVEIVASLFTFDENGKGKWLPKADKYTNEYGIPVTRLGFVNRPMAKRFRRYDGLQAELERIAPELIFIHGIQFMDVAIVADYCKKHPQVKVFADNHSDFSNSANNWVSKYILHRIFWRRCAQKINPYVTKFYGVLPARVDFLVNEYKLPKEKVELLVMGADDESVIAAAKPEVRQELRSKYGISEEDILIVTGGKIDSNKQQVLMLMEAIKAMTETNIKIVVFGSVVPELKSAFDAKLNEKVKYVGWKKANEIYEEFAAADIVAFPGLHSVLWEQAVAMGKPCIFRKINGFSHIDLGGNCVFFTEDSVEEYTRAIQEAVTNIVSLRQIASAKGKEVFSYSKIAERSISGGN